MKPGRCTAVVLFLSLLLAFPAAAQELNADQLQWLSGSWKAELGESVVEEIWLPPRGNTMIGVNRTVRGDASVTFEFLRIARQDGLLVYLASPGGRFPPTEFALVELEENRAVFSNPSHDFPRQITYERNDDGLTATIQGQIDGEALQLSWHFQPVPTN